MKMYQATSVLLGLSLLSSMALAANNSKASTSAAAGIAASSSAVAAPSTKADADSKKDDFDGLGGNKILIERAQALNPDVQTSVVQSRTVSLRNRIELAPEYSGTFGGDTYVRTQNLGLNAYYHFNPRFAVGAKYKMSYNRLTPEGEASYNKAYEDFQKNPRDPQTQVPEINYPKSEMMALINWSPIYGKINWLDQKVVQFDGYVLGGAGQVQLRNSTSSTYLLGGGIGLWFTQNFSTRFEMAYQRYEAAYFTGPVKLDLTLASMQMGWLL